MAVIRYTAKREIETTGYSKSGTDISVNGTNDTFNSVSTSLIGLADNEWVKVAGFANAANNGWFQANGASAATQITQDTSTVLVTEAAGPSITLVGYKRGLNQQYDLEFSLTEATRSAKTLRNESESLSGVIETLRYRHTAYWEIVTEWLTEAKMPQWREFIHSVDARETFTFDLKGTVAAPVSAISCTLDSVSYNEERRSVFDDFRLRLRLRVQ